MARKTPRASPSRSRRTGPKAPVSEDLQCLRRDIEHAERRKDHERYVLRLYVTGLTATSARAIDRVRGICERHLQGRYKLDVIDIYQLPALAKDHQIIATPTLIQELPAPLRRFIGELADVERVLFGLDLQEKR